jgi:hypothetical protein
MLRTPVLLDEHGTAAVVRSSKSSFSQIVKQRPYHHVEIKHLAANTHRTAKRLA